MSTAILVRGPLAVGKTTVSKALAQRLHPCAAISVDKLRKMPSDGDLSPRHLKLAKSNAALLAGRFLAEGYTVVIESVFEKGESIEMVQEVLGRAGVDAFHVVTLTADLDVLESRDAQKRVPNAERVAELHDRFRRTSAPPGIVVDTSALDIEEVVAAICDRFGLDRHRTREVQRGST